MRSRPTKPLMWFVLIVGTLVLGFMSAGAFAAGATKKDVPICKLEDEGYVQRLVTQAQYDRYIAAADGEWKPLPCEDVCPCAGLMAGAVAWDAQSFTTGICIDSTASTVLYSLGHRDNISRQETPDSHSCLINQFSGDVLLTITTTPGEDAACRASLLAIATGDGVTCN